MTMIKPPTADGLYDPRFEHDACGVAMVAGWTTSPRHEVVDARARGARQPRAPRRRGRRRQAPATAPGSSPRSPTRSSARVCDFELPAAGPLRRRRLLPAARRRRCARKLEQLLELNVRVEGQRVLGWRDVPVDEEHVGDTANRSRPHIRQLFIGAGAGFDDDQDAFERKLYVIRRIVELAAGPDFYAPSFSSRTCVYKGMLISPPGCAASTPTSQDERFALGAGARALALLDQHLPELGARPPVPRDRPQRRDQHADGQRQLDARPRVASSPASCSAATSQKVMPIVRPGGSDSATFDNVLELLMLAGRSLPHAVMMMIPEAYQDRDDLSGRAQGLLRLPLLPDGAVGRPGRGLLHRRPRRRRDARPQRPAPRPLGARPRTAASILGSEAGMLGIEPENVKRLGRLQPGKLFLVDLEQGRIVEDEEVKREVATQQPYGEWFDAQRRALRRPRAGASRR